MESMITKIEATQKKSAVVDVRSGDTVRVHQKIIEGGKQRIQIFEGLVIRVGRRHSLTSTITVRRIASGIGVEKTYLMHSPNILKVEIVKRSRVRRNYLSYMRARSGKRARLSSIDFDKEAVNTIADKTAQVEEAKIQEELASAHEAEEADKLVQAETKDAKATDKVADREVQAEFPKQSSQAKTK